MVAVCWLGLPSFIRSFTPLTFPCSSPVVTDVCRPRRFPPLCGRAALWGSWSGIALASSVSMWAGHGFTQNVAMLWLLSSFASFLCSCLLLEPIKVIFFLMRINFGFSRGPFTSHFQHHNPIVSLKKPSDDSVAAIRWQTRGEFSRSTQQQP